MQWQDRILLDACLPLGLRSASKTFNVTADALEWIIAHQGASFVEFVIHYFDHFLLGGSRHNRSMPEFLGSISTTLPGCWISSIAGESIWPHYCPGLPGHPHR